MPFSNATYDGVTLNPFRTEVTQVPGTLKQVVGTVLVQTPIPGRTVMDYRITIRGNFNNSTRGTDRTTLINDYTSKASKAYVDGLHDDNYVIEDLQFEDSGERPEVYDFTITLIQYQQ